MVANEVVPPKAEEVSSTKVSDVAPASGSLPEKDKPDLNDQIIRQVEYYFGDSNLLRDKYLREKISADPDGWVTFEVLLTFKRLAALSEDKNIVAEAMAKSTSGLIEVSEDKEKIRRHPNHPIPEGNDEYRKEVMSRTAYAKGFPLESDMSELIKFFEPYEKVVNITMRKYLHKPTKTHKFKGSVFVTFATVEQAKAFVSKDKIDSQGRNLVRKMQELYLDEKRNEMLKKKAKKEAAKAPVVDDFDLPKGSVVEFQKADESVTREMIRTAISQLDGTFNVAFIDYNKGDKNGRIRFDQEDVVKEFLSKLENNILKIRDGIEIELKALNEEEERAFLNKAREDMKCRRRVARSGRKRRAPHMKNPTDKKVKKDGAEA